MAELDGKKAVVVGASRGLGRGVAESLSAAGASVFAIARERSGLDELEAARPSIEVAYRLREAQVCEHWLQVDLLGLLNQLRA
jgi:NAD(P)-dependent dehydrogenase (short-subunit alcohol dehydrogenase family)